MTKEKTLEIVIDTREQNFFPFPNADVGTLNVGDYSVKGYEKLISIERKAISDACSSVISGRERFEKEWIRAKDYKYFAVVIEGTIKDMRDYLTKQYYIMYKTPIARKKYMWRLTSQLKAVPHTYISWSAKYKVPVFFCDDRNQAMEVTEQFLKDCIKHIKGENDENEQ